MTRLLALLGLLAFAACDQSKPTDKQEAKLPNEDRAGHAACEQGYLWIKDSATGAEYCIPYKLYVPHLQTP